MIVQVPSATNESVVPDTVQTNVVEDASDTARPESEVAVRLTVPVGSSWSPGFAKVMVCSTPTLPDVITRLPVPEAATATNRPLP